MREWPFFRWIRTMICTYNLWLYRTNPPINPSCRSSTHGRREAFTAWGDEDWDGREGPIPEFFGSSALPGLNLRLIQDDQGQAPVRIRSTRPNNLVLGITLPAPAGDNIAEMLDDQPA